MKYEIPALTNIYDAAVTLARLAELDDIETEYNDVQFFIHRGATAKQIATSYFAQYLTSLIEETICNCEDADALEAQAMKLREQAGRKIAQATVHVNKPGE